MKTIQKILILCVVMVFTAFSCEKENDDPDAHVQRYQTSHGVQMRAIAIARLVLQMVLLIIMQP